MSYSVKLSDEEVEVAVDSIVLGEFSFMNGIEGSISEPDIPYKRLHSSQFLALAKFFIECANERAYEEIRQIEHEANIDERKLKLAVEGLYNSLKLGPHVDSKQALDYAEEVLGLKNSAIQQ